MKTYHIVYFESESSYHSRGVNIEAESMSRACEIFTSRYGFEPYYCAVKENLIFKKKYVRKYTKNTKKTL